MISFQKAFIEGYEGYITISIAAFCIVLSILLCVLLFLRNRRTLRVILRKKETDLYSVITLIHYLLCIVFITTTSSIVFTNMRWWKGRSHIEQYVELVLLYVLAVELSCLLVESYFHTLNRKGAPYTFTYPRMKSLVFILGLPLVLVVIQGSKSIIFHRNDVKIPVASLLTIENISLQNAINDTEFVTTHSNLTTVPNTVYNATTTQPLAIVSFAGTTKHTNLLWDIPAQHLHDPLLSLKPIINLSQPILSENISRYGMTVAASQSSNTTIVLTANSTVQVVLDRTKISKEASSTTREEMLVEVEEMKLSLCWITWSLATYVGICLLAGITVLYLSGKAIAEAVGLRQLEKEGSLVPLEEWFALICRPFLGFAICMKWAAVSMLCSSQSATYSLYAILLLTPPLLYVIIGSQRSSTDGRAIGKFSKRFTRSRSNNFELRNKRPVIAQFGLTREIGYKIVSQTPDTDMIQIDEPGRVHINNDILINTQMSNFICDRYGLSAKEMNTKKSSNEKDKENNNEFGDDGYGIIQPKPSSIHDLVQDLSQCLSKCEIAEEKRESLFNDSDYDEVLDFMTSPNPKSSEEVKSPLNDESPADTTEPDLIDSSKRLSSTSASSSMTSSASSTALSTSGVESGEDRPVSKYAELDIAKILHTRKRIHRILQTPPQTSEENEEQDESPPTYTINKKKSSYLTKRYTHYGTVGRHSKGNIAVNRRCSSSSRPASTGDNDCNEYSHWQPRDYSTFDPLRSRTDDNSSTPDSCFTSDARNERPRSRDSDPDDSGETNSTCNASENKRWSRLSSNSQNSDKALLTPSKGPWKAFRKFVNNSGSARAQAHEEMKATIYIRHNSSNNNNNKENMANNNINNNNSAIGNLSPAKTDSKSDEEKGNNVSHNCISSGSVDVSSNYSPASISSSRSSTPSHYSSNSLMRRFSRKSRGRSPRRSSLPSQSAWDVRSGSCKDAGGSPGRKASPAGRFQYGDGSQRTDIESKVMESVENNVRERSKSELNKSSSKSSFRKRFFSFKRKRTQSQGRKSPVSSNEQVDGSENGKMNKSLSYSSPQLSVFAVNSNSKRPGLAQKLVF